VAAGAYNFIGGGVGVFTGCAVVVLGCLFMFFGTGLGYFIGGGVGILTGSYWTLNVGMGE